VYSRNSDGNAILDASTGDLLGTFQASPAPAFAGKIGLYLNGSTLQATSGHRTLWTFSGDGMLDSAPIVVGTTVFVGSSSEMLYGLDLRRGRVVWSTNVGRGIPRPDEQNLSPLTGLGAGQALHLTLPWSADSRLRQGWYCLRPPSRGCPWFPLDQFAGTKRAPAPPGFRHRSWVNPQWL
jgi:hypothetical protein